MLTEMLAVVGRDHHHGVCDQASGIKLAKQAADLIVQVGDVLVVTVASQLDVGRGMLNSFARLPVAERLARWPSRTPVLEASS